MQYYKIQYHTLPAIKKLIYSSLFVFLVFALSANTQAFSPVSPQSDPGYFEKGLEAKINGNFEEALRIWEKSISEAQESDFRIAYSYINLVSEKKMKQYYVKASEIYNWGLKGDIDADEKNFLFKDLKSIRPLIGNGDYKDLKKAVENNNASALRRIKKFWDSIDPTPMTPYNERLLEHWERIHFAKANFVKRNSDEFDDRAFIYIKFGEPFYNKRGQLNYLSSTVSRLVKEGVEPPSFATADQIAINTTQRLNMENQVRRYHNYPRYEVWIYKRLNEDRQNTIYMFGTRDGVSSFRKIQSVEDFIPNAAYRTSGQSNYSISSGNVTQRSRNNTDRENVQVNSIRSSGQKTSKVDFSAALILQLMYYQQFAALDGYFGNSYNEMMNRFTSRSNTIRKGLAREFGSIYGSKLLLIQNAAPDEKSVYETTLMDLPGENYQYRFLDLDNNPYVKVFSVANIENAAYYDLLKNTNSLQTDVNNRYALISGYQLRNEAGEALYEDTDRITLQSLGDFSKVFNISYHKNSASVLISHELHNVEAQDDSLISSESSFRESLKGLSNYTFELPEPLNTNGLVLSDFIIGYSYEDRQSGKVLTDGSLDFTVAHDKVIPQGSELNLYFELYNLTQRASDGLAEYTFEYSIKAEKRGFLGIGKKTEDQQSSIAINNEVANKRDENSISISTAEYEKGDYQLFVEITDVNSGSTYATTQKFSIQ